MGRMANHMAQTNEAVRSAGTHSARVLWAIPLTLLLHAVTVAAESNLSASKISAEIDAMGAKAVINRLSHANVNAMGQSDWSRTMDEIWNGRPAFIALAPKLAAGADGAPADDLGIALARALPAAPASVLRVIDRRDGAILGVSRICGAPFIDTPGKAASGYLDSAQSALDDVDTPGLQRVKAACLARLALAAKHLDSRQGK